MQKRQLQRMAERMFEGFAHNHQVMVFGRQALDVLTASGSLRDGMWHYRERLDCRWQLSEQSMGRVPHHEFRALQITVDRREPCEGRSSSWSRRCSDQRSGPSAGATATIISRRRPALTA